jgi:arylsulfatase
MKAAFTFIMAMALSIMHVSAQNKPNVIIIMTDDQGYGELSYYGNPILKTPQLDKLAEQSIRFEDFHVAPMCTPTRGQLMTGMDAARNGAVNVSSGRTLLRPELPTIADFFTENGYNTGIFGKWHLGDNYPYSPEYRGFQETVWFPSSHISSVPDFWGNDYFDDTYIHNGKREKFKGYCTDIFFDKTMNYILTSVQQDTHFFIYLPTNTPHWPFFVPEEDLQALTSDYAESSFANEDLPIKDDLLHYLAMIRNIDTNVGRLRDFLENNSLSNNTILIFLTDNGSTFAPRYYEAGMRGMKTQLWEGGHRVPLFIHYPSGGFTDPREVSGVTQVQDILPTLIDLCDLETQKPTNFDGISLVPQLRNDQDAPDDRMLVINYSRMPFAFDYPSPYAPSLVRKDGAAVLWKRWRLLKNIELYDLESDPMQETNVIDQFPDVAEKMRDHLDKWWKSVLPVVNQPQRLIIGNEKENPTLLTACEWLDVFVDQQVQIQRGVRKNGYWLLDVDQSGIYEFELRRWPREADLPLSGSVDDFVKLPIASARIFIDPAENRIHPVPFSFIEQKIEVSAGDRSAIFTVELNEGPITLHTWFDDQDQIPICGAYYVYVRRK